MDLTDNHPPPPADPPPRILRSPRVPGAVTPNPTGGSAGRLKGVDDVGVDSEDDREVTPELNVRTMNHFGSLSNAVNRSKSFSAAADGSPPTATAAKNQVQTTCERTFPILQY